MADTSILSTAARGQGCAWQLAMQHLAAHGKPTLYARTAPSQTWRFGSMPPAAEGGMHACMPALPYRTGNPSAPGRSGGSSQLCQLHERNSLPDSRHKQLQAAAKLPSGSPGAHGSQAGGGKRGLSLPVLPLGSWRWPGKAGALALLLQPPPAATNGCLHLKPPWGSHCHCL